MRLHGITAGRESAHVLRGAKRRMRLDTVVGMVFSNGVAFFVMLMGAVVLHAGGVTDVTSAAQAAQALRPLAGDFAFMLFSFGIIATGLLAVPIMAAMMLLAARPAVMGPLPVRRKTRFLGWGAVPLMTAAVLMMGWDLVR